MLRRILRVLFAVVGILACLAGIRASGRAGFARLLAYHGRASSLVLPATGAVTLSPSDSEAHFARAIALRDTGALPDAVQEMEMVVALRPHDYFMWYELSQLRDQVDDAEGAISAATESVRLAPFYGRPRWLLGNLLFRAGRFDEAFAELRRGAQSDQTLLPNVIDLAWGAYGGDVSAVEEVIQPQTAQWRQALARFYVRHQKPVEALALFRASGEISELDRRALLAALIEAKHFTEAYEFWASANASGSKSPSPASPMYDGGFEKGISKQNFGFGWQLSTNMQGINASLDQSMPREGNYSLLLDYNGNSNPTAPVLSQLVIVEANARYHLSFGARDKDLVTGGLPFVSVTDVSGKEPRALNQSATFSPGTNGWQDFNFDFATGNETRAVVITFQRQNCNDNQCPAFGRIWLDDFSLKKL